jgi:cytochrome P450
MSILNALDPQGHSRFRKAMEPGFTERAVRNQEVIMQRYTSALISQLGKLVGREEGGMVVDIVRSYGFTIFDQLEIWDLENLLTVCKVKSFILGLR